MRAKRSLEEKRAEEHGSTAGASPMTAETIGAAI